MGKEKVVVPKWIIGWLILDLFIIVWDASFCLLRPHSLPGGKLGWIWTLGNKPDGFGYATYIRADFGYGDVKNTWVWAQALGNALEMFVQIFAVYLAVCKKPSATLWTFIVCLMTWWKTVLYFFVCYVNPSAVFTTDMKLWLSAFLLPNVFWLLIPLACMVCTGRIIVKSLSNTPQHFKKEN